MKLITIVVFLLCVKTSYADEINLNHFAKIDLPVSQSGCWYYYPSSKKQSGNVIGVGKSAEDAIHLIINGEKIVIGNWKVDYQNKIRNISYSSPQYNVAINSVELSASKYSSQYISTLTVASTSGKTKLEVFSECGS